MYPSAFQPPYKSAIYLDKSVFEKVKVAQEYLHSTAKKTKQLIHQTPSLKLTQEMNQKPLQREELANPTPSFSGALSRKEIGGAKTPLHRRWSQKKRKGKESKPTISNRVSQSVSVPLLFFSFFVLRHIVQPPSIPLALHPNQIPTTPLPL